MLLSLTLLHVQAGLWRAILEDTLLKRRAAA